MTTITIMLVFFVGEFALATWALFKGSRWAKVKTTNKCRAFAAVMLIQLWGIASGLVSDRVVASPTTMLEAALYAAILLLIVAAVQWVIILLVFRTTIGKSIKAWLPMFGCHLVFVSFLWFVYKPYMFETFSIPANSMAPTILGRHIVADCPHCDGPAYASPALGEYEHRSVLTICANDYRIRRVELEDVPQEVHTGDYILTNKMLRPRRWDLIVFRYPLAPAHSPTRYVMRLVGLPGETIVIRDGVVYANSQALALPASLKQIEYRDHESEADDRHFAMTAWATPAKPAVLHDDEYFVLGDFSLAAKDSRFWGTRATQSEGPAPNPERPYVVPGANIEGLATHIYWPLSRMRRLR